MSLLTPETTEYELQSNYITEALDLLGQECRLYYVESKDSDLDMDNIITYSNHTVESKLLFEDNLEVKLKGRKWMKERDEAILAYISLENVDKIVEGVIVEVDCKFITEDSRFIITTMFGQVNTTYIKVKLVPYRKSLRTSTDPNKPKKDTFTTSPEGIKRPKPFLNRENKSL